MGKGSDTQALFYKVLGDNQTCGKPSIFSKMENRKVKQVLSGGWYQWEGRGYKERV
jgi:hypothetical protein